jgi:hypothetical protein
MEYFSVSKRLLGIFAVFLRRMYVLAILSYMNRLKCCKVCLRLMSVVHSLGCEWGDLMVDSGILAETLKTSNILHSVYKIRNFNSQL